MGASDLLERERAGVTNQPIRFVIFVSYGNDSIALIQWAHEQDLTGVAVVFTDTKWAADGWMERVEKAEAWVRSIGFTPYRTSSIGFRQLAREKKGFPTQRYQWCSAILKIMPGVRWLEEYDPDARAVCLIGVRREESDERAQFPAYLLNSANHGNRVMVAPFVEWTAEQRNNLIAKTSFPITEGRSRECKCINSNRDDMQRYTDRDWQEIGDAEAEIGKPMYRPHRHMGAKGAAEVRRWADAKRGQYRPPEPMPEAVDLEDAESEENLGGCDTFGGCGR